MKNLNFPNTVKSVFSKIKFYVYLKTDDPNYAFEGDLEEFMKTNLTKVIIGLNQMSLESPVRNELLLKVKNKKIKKNIKICI